MDISLNSCRERVREAAVTLLWRQWCTLGIAGNARPVSDVRLIDLDALVLATSSIGRYDPRLFDEALDWLAEYGFLVNLQRVKNLHKKVGLGDKQVLCVLSDWLRTEAGQPRWKLFVECHFKTGHGGTVPLFLEQGHVQARNPDPLFIKHGLERNVYTPRGMARPPDPKHSANLMPALRALVGVSARVEILLYLGGSTASAHASEIAQATCYVPRTLQIQLQEMQLSGQILGPPRVLDRDAPVRRGANRSYALKDQVREFLVPGKPFPIWTPWASLFRISELVLELFPKQQKSNVSTIVISSRLREVMKQETKALATAGLWPRMNVRLESKGEEFLEDFCKSFPRLLEELTSDLNL